MAVNYQNMKIVAQCGGQRLHEQHAALYFGDNFDTLFIMTIHAAKKTDKLDPVWQTIRKETACEVEREPVLASFLHATILNHDTLETALSFHLAHSLDSPAASALLVREVIEEAFISDPSIGGAIRADICAVFERDSACGSLSIPFLYFKGFHALQSYRIAHALWLQGRTSLALYFQNRISCEFGVDIHPAARIGQGILMDHATGIVIGETAVVGNNVSIMQSVTLGGTGKEEGDRHPKVADGVLLSAGAKILGNIHIGEGAQVMAGSVVLRDVPPHTVVAGVPAKVIGKPDCQAPALSMNHRACCDE
ncbi:serine acetyltransferase [gamma proteobacterium BDW918]|jgi:serine O-acetyltransferase|uniref:Serine acetyltransferase n=2 Tax=Zhongshania TaxID=1434050 RepID=A0A127M2X6_9GAMM|nr:serine acetyltransferase [Zhongshania aliphaticivorans]EIF45025.1 serine acetyltransferase [gamma proteobacterium BDW918]